MLRAGVDVGAMLLLSSLAGLPAVAADPGVGEARSQVQAEAELAVTEPGPHEGTGATTAYPFFADEPDFDLVFRKRALHPGSSIGLHRNDKDEIYYVLNGRGELTLQGEVREVRAGDAILTRVGHSHALRTLGDTDLVIFVVYRKPAGALR